MADRSPGVITTSASSWLGASLGAELASLIVLPIGFLLSIWLSSMWMFYLTLAGWLVLAGTGGFWIRRHRFRFDPQQQMLERQTLWFLRPAHVHRIKFERIRDFEIADSKHGPRLRMRLEPGGNWVVKTGSRPKLEQLQRTLRRFVQPATAASEVADIMNEESIAPATIARHAETPTILPAQTPTLTPPDTMTTTNAPTLPDTSTPAPTVFHRSDLPLRGMVKLKVGVIGGSGLGQLLDGHAGQGRRHEIHTPFGACSDSIIETEWAGVPVFLLSRHGPGHLLNPTQVPYRANIFALKQLGCTHIVASGAVGSLREEMKPRDLAIPDQIIDRTTKRPGTFYENTAVHVEFSEPFCPVLRQVLVDAAATTNEASPATHAVHARGCYVAMEGPAFSTRAESLMHRLWGGDLIGMTAMPEARLAREAEISYALVALVTDYDCWRQKAPPAPGQVEQKPAEAVDPFVLLNEIIANLDAASANAMALIRRAIEQIATRQEQLMSAPSRNSLQLAIWSDRARIPIDEIERLRVLWGRYFSEPLSQQPAKQDRIEMEIENRR